MNNRRTPLTINASPQKVVSDLRRAIILGRVSDFGLYSDKPLTQFNGEACYNSLAEVPKAHVFDTEYLFDPQHPDYISTATHKALFAEGRDLMHRGLLCLPFPHSLFIRRQAERGGKPGCFVIHYMRRNEIIGKGMDNIMALCLVYETGAHSRGWFLAGLIAVDDRQSKADGFTDDLAAKNALFASLSSLALLNRKGDTVVVEPAESIEINEPTKPKAFEIANPSVSIVRVNTKRILQTAPSEPTGATVRPHDRRAHLRRVGNRIIKVRDSKIHGGVPSPTAKVVKTSTDFT